MISSVFLWQIRVEDVKFIMPLELQSVRQLTLVATKSGAGGIVSDKHRNMMKYVGHEWT